MPWDVTKDPRCPADKPWGVVKQGDESLEGCHESEDMAKAQQAALYANAPDRESQVPAIEYMDAREAWPLEDMQLTADRKGLHFRGYAAVFDVWSNPRPWRMTIHQESFSATLSDRGRPKKMFLNHNDGIVLGSTRKGTLRLNQDSRGLLTEADLPDNEWGRPVADAVERGDIEGMSIGYRVPRSTKTRKTERWSEDRMEREVWEIDLFEVSPITSWPGFSQTTVSVQSLLTPPDELAAALAVLQSINETLTEEQLSLLTASIESHRARPTPAEVRAQWAERFGLPV